MLEQSRLINQIDKEMPFLPDDWDGDDLICFALRFMLSNGDAVEELLGEE